MENQGKVTTPTKNTDRMKPLNSGTPNQLKLGRMKRTSIVNKYKIRNIFIAPFFLLCLAPILSDFYQDSWLLSLIDQARIQLTVFSLFLTLLLLVLRNWKSAGLTFVLLIYNAFIVVSAYSRESGIDDFDINGATNEKLRVLSSNMYADNKDTREFLTAVKLISPSVIFLMEVNGEIFNELDSQLSPNFPFSLHQKKKYQNEYIAFFSKYPLLTEKLTEKMVDRDLSIVSVRIQLERNTIHFFGVHPISPRNEERMLYRNYQLDLIARYVSEHSTQGVPFILAGDMNVTPWSRPFRDLMTTAKLTHSDSILDINMTWPSWLPPPFRIPIDQILTSRNFCDNHSYQFDIKGSDHSLVYSDLLLCE
jgi:endonuclease/exonuclease/phosphatase (EEP) superfamily protein YafD